MTKQSSLHTPPALNPDHTRRDRLIVPLALLCIAFSALMMVQTRDLFLDDTFIHLRIASNLAAHGIYSFNGDAPAYSTSSPLYTALLAGLWKWLHTIWLPKLVGIAVFASLLILIGRPLIRGQRSAASGTNLAWLIAVTSPMAIRWLTDGMETGLVALTAITLGQLVAALRLESNDARSSLRWKLGIVAALATLLRVEFAYLVALSVGAFVADALWQRIRPSRPVRFGLLWLIAGSALSLTAVHGYFGDILPDTAIAKADVGSSAAATLLNTVRSHLAASLFGVGTLVTWLISLSGAWRVRHQRVFVTTINAGLPVLLVLIAARHQSVQGYRYFVFIEFFLLAVNAVVVARSPEPELGRTASRWRPIALLGLIALLVAWETFDWRHLEVLSAGRSATFEKFRQGDLSDLHGRRGLAWDVGMIGEFSQSTILDPNGLVNGREMARLPKSERLQRLTATPIDFVFANDQQLAELDGLLDTKSWHLRGEYQFPNFSGNPDTHHLLVRESGEAQTAVVVAR
jgi:hypothetical protein